MLLNNNWSLVRAIRPRSLTFALAYWPVDFGARERRCFLAAMWMRGRMSLNICRSSQCRQLSRPQSYRSLRGRGFAIFCFFTKSS